MKLNSQVTRIVELYIGCYLVFVHHLCPVYIRETDRRRETDAQRHTQTYSKTDGDR